MPAIEFITSARPTTPASARPLPIPFANVSRSGYDAVRLVAPEVLSGPAPAGLHLVGDVEDAGLVEHLPVAGEHTVRCGHEPAHALDRLGDQCRHVAGCLGREDLAQIGDPRPSM